MFFCGFTPASGGFTQYDYSGNTVTVTDPAGKQQTLTDGNLPGGIGQPNFTIDETTNRINGFSYDAAGNLTGDGSFTYAYDGSKIAFSIVVSTSCVASAVAISFCLPRV